MPTDQWKKTVHFANVASMGYNKSLLRILFRAVPEIWGLSLQDYLEHLIQQMEQSSPKSTFGLLWERLDAYTDSILSNNAYQLPYFSDQDRPWELDEALSIVVLLNTNQFFAELYAHSASILEEQHHAQLQDLLLYQRHCIPNRHPNPHSVHFSWDWLSYHHSRSLQRQPTTLQFQQPFYSVMGDNEQFVNMYLNLMQARGSSTQQVITALATATREVTPPTNHEIEAL